MDTLNKRRLLNNLKDPESRQYFYTEHIATALPIQTRELRKKRKLTQSALAKLVGTDQKNISDWENPNYEFKPQIGTLMKLANVFDVPLIVRFGSWEELWEWEHGLSPERLAPREFDEALPDLEKSVAESEATSNETKGSIKRAGSTTLYAVPANAKARTQQNSTLSQVGLQRGLYPIAVPDSPAKERLGGTNNATRPVIPSLESTIPKTRAVAGGRT